MVDTRIFIVATIAYRHEALDLAAGYSVAWLLYLSILAFLIFKSTVIMDGSVIALRALFCLGGAAKASATLGLLWTFVYFCASGLLHNQGAPGLALSYSMVWFFFLLAIVYIVFRRIPNC